MVDALRRRPGLKMMHPASKDRESSVAFSTLSQSYKEIANARPLAASGGSLPNDGLKRSILRLDNLIIRGYKHHEGPGGSSSNMTTKAMNRKCKISVTSMVSGRRKSSILSDDGRDGGFPRADLDGLFNNINFETDNSILAEIRNMTRQEVAAAAALAVAEAEEAMAKAEEAMREAEAAEAEAEAAAEAALKALREGDAHEISYEGEPARDHV